MVREKFFKIYHKSPKIGIGTGVFGILTREFSLFTLQIIIVIIENRLGLRTLIIFINDYCNVGLAAVIFIAAASSAAGREGTGYYYGKDSQGKPPRRKTELHETSSRHRPGFRDEKK